MTDSCQYGCHLPYMGIDTTAHVQNEGQLKKKTEKNVVCDMPTITKNASSEPGLSNEKWHVSLGQNVWQLKKVVGAFPIITSTAYAGGNNHVHVS